MLSQDARTLLSVASIFRDPPTSQMFTIATEYGIERVDRGMTELIEVTLMTRSTNATDGRVTFVALPITLSFARYQLGEMGSFEIDSRRRVQRFTDQMELHQAELSKFQSRFEQYGLDSDSERRAAILCQRGESEMFIGNTDNAEALFKQARDLAPRSAYIYAMSASYELARNRVGTALAYANQACGRVTRKNGALCYTIKARILDVQGDRSGRVEALSKAVEFEPENAVARHQYGVALSIARQTQESIAQFGIIIDRELHRDPPGLQLLMSLKTRIINLKRLERVREVAADLAMAKDIIARFPHLAAEEVHFREFQ